jgi:hypothetical protein
MLVCHSLPRTCLCDSNPTFLTSIKERSQHLVLLMAHASLICSQWLV